MDAISWAFVIIVGYLIGSLPSAYIAGRILKGRDIRKLGDNNSGAANAYHNLGRITGITVCVIDTGKGAAAVLLAHTINDASTIHMVAGISAVAGHNWPFFLHFRGGRGAATTLGILMFIAPVAAIPMSLGCLVLLLFSRNPIVALSFAFIATPILAWILGINFNTIAYMILLPTIVGVSHFSGVMRAPRTHMTKQTASRISE